MKKVSFHTIGCRLNQSETALLVNGFTKSGYQPVAFGTPTDLLVVNTCSVTESAEADCRMVVRRTLKHSPHAVVAVTGCYAQTGRDVLQKIPGIDLIVGNQHKMTLSDFLSDHTGLTKQPEPTLIHTRTLDREDFTLPGVGEYSTTRANLKIQDGCNFMCSFCLIPYARGRERSRLFEDAIREAEALVDQGHQELVLTGVNIGRFGSESLTLVDLLVRLEAITGLKRIRISSIEPTTVSDTLIDYMADSEKVCRFIHIPLQSGDDTVLKNMNRHYTVKDYLCLLDKFLKRIPDVCIGTDVMVGYPGETDEQFSRTMNVIRDGPFAYVHVFSFSLRPGTPAARVAHPVPTPVVKARSRELSKLSRLKRFGFYQRFIDRQVSVLFESRDTNGLWVGLTDHYVKVGIRSSVSLTNQIHPVVIVGVTDGLALGRIVDSDQARQCRSPLPMVQQEI